MIETCVVHAGHSKPLPAFAKQGVDIYTCPTCGCVMADTDFAHEQYESDDYYTVAFDGTDEIEAHWGFRWRYILGRLLDRCPRI